jgi:hypothetical protein
MKSLGIVNVRFNVTDQLLIRFSAFIRLWRRNENTMRQYTNVHSHLHENLKYHIFSQGKTPHIEKFLWTEMSNDPCVL